MQSYSLKITAKKAASELGLVLLAAVAVALGGAMLEPATVGVELPSSEVGVLATAILSALGRGLINWAKNRTK